MTRARKAEYRPDPQDERYRDLERRLAAADPAAIAEFEAEIGAGKKRVVPLAKRLARGSNKLVIHTLWVQHHGGNLLARHILHDTLGYCLLKLTPFFLNEGRKAGLDAERRLTVAGKVVVRLLKAFDKGVFPSNIKAYSAKPLGWSISDVGADASRDPLAYLVDLSGDEGPRFEDLVGDEDVAYESTDNIVDFQMLDAALDLALGL